VTPPTLEGVGTVLGAVALGVRDAQTLAPVEVALLDVGLTLDLGAIGPVPVSGSRLTLVRVESDGTWTPLAARAEPPDTLRATIRSWGTLAVLSPVTMGTRIDAGVLATLGDADTGFAPRYLAPAAALEGAHPFDLVRVRFSVLNDSGHAATFRPRLEMRREGTTPFTVVPDRPRPGAALHVDREWVRTARGSHEGPPALPLEVSEFLLQAATSTAGAASGTSTVAGQHVMSGATGRAILLASGAYTEEEFTVRVGIDARPGTGYELRLTDAGSAVSGAVLATVRIGAPEAARMTPGQLLGVPVGSAVAAAGRPRYGLRTAAATTLAVTPNATILPGIHGPYSDTADQCSACHRTHIAQARSLLAMPSPQSNQCFSCHDGLGALSDVKSQYTDVTVPANNPATRTYYRHDALATTTHTLAAGNEFQGVSDRHSECGDCHNSHRATSTSSATTASGWTSSGRLNGAVGVTVTNGAAGTAPTYAFRDGVNQPSTLEYQLCFTCHSGFTTLPGNAGFGSSRYVLDKGVEFNPANGSTHPIEAPGKNTTTQMAASLSGTSPFKKWNFLTTSTIRCLNCHAGSRALAGGATPLPGADLAPHTSSVEGILLATYRNRLLHNTNDAYSAGDFALCYTCHAEAPFAGTSNSATNFSFHSLHVRSISAKGSGGTDIDVAGGGRGNALCAECHFRIHSTAYPDGTQTVTGSRLVSFSPNIGATGGVRSWTKSGNGGNCTLVCHGKTHNNYSY
jgi:predicted CXXCH cytochrome family protein